jgi:hypothetical protein
LEDAEWKRQTPLIQEQLEAAKPECVRRKQAYIDTVLLPKLRGKHPGKSDAELLELAKKQLDRNPGIDALLSRFLPGHKTGAALTGEEPLQLVNSLKNRFGNGGYYMAAQFAEMFGMDEPGIEMDVLGLLKNVW